VFIRVHPWPHAFLSNSGILGPPANPGPDPGMSVPLPTPRLGGQTRSPQGPPQSDPPGRRHRYPFRLRSRAIVRFSPLWTSYSVNWSPLVVRALLPAVLVAFATGLLDDIFGLKPWMKLLGQILAAVLACNANVQIHGIGGHAAAGAWWQIPLTILWLVGFSNAFNLIDGLDGLAVGVGLFATATAFLSALLTGNIALAFVTAPLLGALLGFLPYNFNPASIFMGDCGSLTVGFLLGCFGVIWSQKSATLLGMTAPLIAMAIPLLDTALAISRRFLRGQAIFAGDRGHIHHRLLARGFTPRRIAFLLYASAGVLACLSLRRLPEMTP
jgi:UDP-GlcNAc:undecaprenyl-phosphate GlcNAc-1-phosphate transferase